MPGLSPEMGAAVEKLLDVQMYAAVIAERDAVVLGFRLAVQMILDATRILPVSQI